MKTPVLPSLLFALSFGCGEVVSDPPPRPHWLHRLGTDDQDDAWPPLIDGTDILLPAYSDAPQVLAGTSLPSGEYLVRFDSSGRAKTARSFAPWNGGLRPMVGGDWLFVGGWQDGSVEHTSFVRRLDRHWNVHWSWGEQLGNVGGIANAGFDDVGNVYAIGREGYDQAFVAKLDASGGLAWQRYVEGGKAWSIGVTAGGEVTYAVDLSSGSFVYQELVVRLDTEGEARWQVDRPFEDVQEILVDALDRVLVVSECHPEDNPIDPDVCLWFFAPDGAELWHQRLHDAELGLHHGGTTRWADRILITAVSTYTAPPEELQSPQALLLIELDPESGDVRSRRELAKGKVVSAGAPALLDGALVVSGSFAGTVDFGIGSLTSKDTRDIFLAKLP